MLMNAALCASSRKIKAVVTSTGQSETIAGVDACKDIVFGRLILSFLDMTVEGPTPNLIDSKAMWFNVRNIGVSAATRHWELWELYVRECYHRMIISVHKVDTDDEFADVLTKAIPKEDEKFGRFCATLLNLPR